ncbi:MAG TPA: hypothetical protein VHE60_18045 [Pyrinomonadaceae bacterium]|nr:hypothetical protein [Pyrinomonadaceae bacterium]
MTAAEAISFIQEHGVVLASAKGPVPRLTEAIVDEPIKGSWWAHSRSHQIFAVLEAIADSDDVLVCRLVNGKVTFIHRRLWPALVRVAKRFPSAQIAQVHEVHTASGRHVTREVPFPKWVPPDVVEHAKGMSEKEALDALGPWASTSRQRREM